MSSAPSPVVVFWRPGCPYCTRLRSRLHRAGVRIEEIDIWENPSEAAFVRSVNGGNETVPTVRMWDEVLINPSPRLVIDEIRRRDPELIGGDLGLRRSRRRLPALQWVVVVALIVSSLVAEGLGHPSLSWLIDAVALTWYLVMRTLLRSLGRRERVPGVPARRHERDESGW